MKTPGKEVATLGGGCFWCLEAVFEQVEGVQQVVSGYAGGSSHDPSYEDVCTGETGHAEVVQVTFDSSRVSFRELLEIYFTIHDPTTLNRQGNDVGSQYRSIVLHHGPDQESTARAVVHGLTAEGLWGGPIVTEIAAFRGFFPAEPYHQGYYRRNPSQGYCTAVVRPKVAKFRAKWASKLRRAPQDPSGARAPT